MRRFFTGVIFLITLSSINSYSQQIPLNSTFTQRVNAAVQYYDVPFQSTMKPWLQSELDTLMNIDSILYPVINKEKVDKHLVTRKIFSENLIRFRYKGAYIYLDPLFDFSIGGELKEGKTVWKNTRGFMITGGLNKSLRFFTEFYENQAVFPSYIDSMVVNRKVLPGLGDPKPFKSNGWDYSFCNAALNYIPSSNISFTLGYGRNFIGDGYRSMILSDVAFPYPYLRVDANLWKLKYTILYAQFMDLNEKPSDLWGWNRKWTTMHFLQVMLWKRLNIGLFDAIVWQNADSTGYRGFEFQYLNPIIFLRPIEYSLSSPDNALIGATFNLRVIKSLSVYGQLLIDEFSLSHMTSNDGWWGNKNGFQLGVAGWNLFKVNNLNARAEYNQARPYTYSSDTPMKAYGHYNQPLAHPLGANFREFLAMAYYTYRHWAFSFKVTHAQYGADTASANYGQDIFRSYNDRISEYDNRIGQGLKTSVTTTDTRIAYLLNPRTNMRIEASLFTRMLSNDLKNEDAVVISVGFKTSLFNFYQDF